MYIFRLCIASLLSLQTLLAGYGVQLFLTDGAETHSAKTFFSEKLDALKFTLQEPLELPFEAILAKKSSQLASLDVYTLAYDEVLREWLLSEPSMASFALINLPVYKKKGAVHTVASHVRPKEMLDIAAIQDPAIRKAFTKQLDTLDRALKTALEAQKQSLEYEKLPTHPMHYLTLPFDREEELSLFLERFQERFEHALEAQKLTITHYKNLVQTYKDLDLPFERYDAFFLYAWANPKLMASLCAIERPDSATMLPSLIYFYVERGQNVLHIGLPKMETVVALLNLNEPQVVQKLQAVEGKLLEIFTKEGAVRFIPPELAWESSYQTALEKAKKENNPLFVFMNQAGCGSCAFMKEQVFTQTDVVNALSGGYIPLSLNIHLNDAPKALQTAVTPVLHFINPDGTKRFETYVGGKNAIGLIKLLEEVSAAQAR